MIEKAQVLEALRGVQDPELGKSLVELGMVHDVEVGDARVHFALALTTLACPLKERITTPGRRSWRWTECGTCRSICAR